MVARPLSFDGQDFRGIGDGLLDPAVLPAAVVQVAGLQPFTAPQGGVAPTDPAHLTTRAWVEANAGSTAWQGLVSATVAVLPSSPATGTRVILSTDSRVYTWTGTAWIAAIPAIGWTLWLTGTGYVSWNGASWVALPSVLSHQQLASLQGGQANESYHLTVGQHTALTGSNAAGLVYATPAGAAGSPTLRALAASDIASGVVSRARGGLGADTSLLAGYAKFAAGSITFGAKIPWADVTAPVGGFTPTVHALSHQIGGADQLALHASQVTSGYLSAARGGTGVDGSSVLAGRFLASPTAATGTLTLRALVPDDISGHTGPSQVLVRNDLDTANVWVDISSFVAGPSAFPEFIGSTAGAAGVKGAVPAPAAGDEAKFLRGDGGWSDPAPTPTFVAAGPAHATGLVPDPGATVGATKYLREDATWAEPPGGGVDPTQFPVFIASGASNAKGVVPAPGATAGSTKFLREDATWADPPGGGTGEVNTASNVNAAGIGIFDAKTALNLGFRGIKAGSSKLTVGLSAGDKTVAIDVDPAQFPVFIASGASNAKGVVPAPGVTAGTTKFLREDATWVVPPDTGEVNTASNVNTAGVGIFEAKTGIDLTFRGVKAASTKVTVVSSAGDKTVAIDVAPAQFPVFIASGASNAKGVVPAPGGTAGTTKFLREDATWVVPPASGGGVGADAEDTIVAMQMFS